MAPDLVIPLLVAIADGRLSMALFLLVMGLPAALLLATVLRFRGAAILSVSGAVLAKAGSLAWISESGSFPATISSAGWV